jgi:hypothetical protein
MLFRALSVLILGMLFTTVVSGSYVDRDPSLHVDSRGNAPISDDTGPEFGYRLHADIASIRNAPDLVALGDSQNAKLTVYILTEKLTPSSSSTEVRLSGSIQTSMIALDGEVTFEDLPLGQPLEVTPHQDINPLNGVSTYDLLLIQRYLLGMYVMPSPYRLIAADVNNSGNVSISDIIELRKVILHPGLKFTNNTSWRFVDASYVFPNPFKPFGFPETVSFPALELNNTAQFIGVKIGDVSGNMYSDGLQDVELRNTVGTLRFSIADRMLAAGEEYTVAVTAEEFRGIQGYQYTLDFDATALEFVGVQAQWADLSAANFGTARAGEGLLTTSWNGNGGMTLDEGEVLYTVTFRAKAATRLSQALKVNSRVTKAEAYDAGEDLLDVQFRFDGDVLVGGDFELYQNEPNPFRDLTIIGFHLPERTTATLKVYDVTGKVLKVVSGEFAKGYNQVNLTRAELQGNGALIYQLDTPTHSATKRMILLD